MAKRTVAAALAVYGFEATPMESGRIGLAHDSEPSGFREVLRADGTAPASFDDPVRLNVHLDENEEADTMTEFPSVHALLAHLRDAARTIAVDNFGGFEEGAGFVLVQWNGRSGMYGYDAASGALDDGEGYDVIAQHPTQRAAILAAIAECATTGEGQTVELP